MQPASQPAIQGERYVDWSLIGRGASAEVFRVRDTELEIDLAIKLLHPERAGKDRDKQAMRNEVRISRALRHPFICPIHDVYDGERGFGVVMDLLHGDDLKTWMAQHRRDLNETFEIRLDLIAKLLEALHIAHQRIVHRDLKPANIFLRGGDIEQPLILDFGLSILDARIAGFRRGGTPRYMAPEQRESGADLRADLFALGILSYELLTNGHHPYELDAGRLLDGRVWQRAEPIAPSEHCALIDPALERLIMQMIRIDPDQRPPDAGDTLATLAAARAEPRAAPRAERDMRIETVSVPGGTYSVGSHSSSRYPAEKPMRRIEITPFRIACTPVTNGQYVEFARQTGYPVPTITNAANPALADHPVVGVTQAEARAFAAWAGGRLPGEFEWEVAAKAGAPVRTYPWGEEAPTPRHMNFDSNVGVTTSVHAHPAGRNEWGLWDMSGNIAEWCLDRWQSDRLRTLANGEAYVPDPAGEDDEVCVRGGGHGDLPGMCRCAFRQQDLAIARRADLGFRIVFDDEAVAPGADGGSATA